MLPISEFATSNEVCAVGVGKGEKFCHCGILYKRSGNSYFLHLGNPAALYNSTNDEGQHGYMNHNKNYKWNPFVNVIPEAQNLIITKCSIIADANTQLEYGIFYENNAYFDDKGKLQLEGASGLTCATFVKTILKCCEVDIVHDENWPDDREEDLTWTKNLKAAYISEVKKLEDLLFDTNKKLRASTDTISISLFTSFQLKFTDQIKRFKKTISELDSAKNVYFIRFRPEEIAGASYHDADDFPLGFTDPSNPRVKDLGENVLSELSS